MRVVFLETIRIALYQESFLQINTTVGIMPIRQEILREIILLLHSIDNQEIMTEVFYLTVGRQTTLSEIATDLIMNTTIVNMTEVMGVTTE